MCPVQELKRHTDCRSKDQRFKIKKIYITYKCHFAKIFIVQQNYSQDKMFWFILSYFIETYGIVTLLLFGKMLKRVFFINFSKKFDPWHTKIMFNIGIRGFKLYFLSHNHVILARDFCFTNKSRVSVKIITFCTFYSYDFNKPFLAKGKIISI